jgi:hypothetical protein
MSDINAKLIIGSTISIETELEIKESFPTEPGQAMGFFVFEIEYKGRIFYCSWSGGELRPEGIAMTLVGRAAYESLKNLPMGNNGAIVVQEMKLGKTPLKDKIIALLEETPEYSKICFLGDLEGELSGQINNVFTPVGMIDLDD